MNQESINTLTEKIKVGDLVEVLFQESSTFGLVVAITLGHGHNDHLAKKRNMTFVTLSTKQGIRKYPIFWCKTID
jgi:hypothetical protein